jgi:pyruvate dehydrogenase E2 component (dihydrolipoamide acetyltransferase)
MQRILTMPRLGETMEEGTIIGWLVDPGRAFRRGEPILEIETDKTVVEYPALDDGVLDEVIAGPGERIAVGAPIARVSTGEAAERSGEGRAEPDPPVAAPAGALQPAAGGGGRCRATPPARRLARQKGLPLEELRGSGRRGRIERIDVERAAGPVGACVTLAPAADIAVEVAGSGSPTCLLIHGFAGDRSVWAATASALQRAGYRTAALDLPGHGETAAEAPDLPGLVDAAAAVAQGLSGRLLLVGHSLGAAVATALAARLGDRVGGLVLLAPAGCGPRIGAEFVHGMARATTPGEVGHLLRLLGPKGGSLSDTALAQIAAQMARGRLAALAGALASPEGRQRIDLIRPLMALPEGLPVRAIFGTEDRIVPAADALNLPSRVAVHFLRCGHMPQWDAPQEVAALIQKGARHG